MSDLAEFLLARITDDEVVARAAAQRPGAERWRWYASANDAELVPALFTDEYLGESQEVVGLRVSLRSVAEFPAKSLPSTTLPVFVLGYAEEVPSTTALYLTRFDAARVLAECEVKRRLVDNAAFVFERGFAGGMYADFVHATLRLLALPYADHPDYRQEWKP